MNLKVCLFFRLEDNTQLLTDEDLIAQEGLAGGIR